MNLSTENVYSLVSIKFCLKRLHSRLSFQQWFSGKSLAWSFV